MEMVVSLCREHPRTGWISWSAGQNRAMGYNRVPFLVFLHCWGGRFSRQCYANIAYGHVLYIYILLLLLLLYYYYYIVILLNTSSPHPGTNVCAESSNFNDQMCFGSAPFSDKRMC